MTIKTALEDQIHSGIPDYSRVFQISTYVINTLRYLELKGNDSKRNNFPAQKNFENRALTWFEIEHIEDIPLK